MSTPEFLIRPTAADDWREIRELRLEMIRDTPTAYTETLETAVSHGEAEWRMRAQRGASGNGIAIAAIAESGRWIGTMAGFVPDPETGAILVGVYVAPDFRGIKMGLTDALLNTVEDWARKEGDQLTLQVHEDNIRAQKAYVRRGFMATGHTVAYNLDPSKKELEMTKTL
ncbi:N-acetyltransferase [Cryobacterium sp. Y11]|uniref:GNAT family N-acetyltransferase n=1 Tax=Cryobacterium sp. Y11 TaxID=2045016 RepID=UPI000CE34B22|nr:GNAT family N-acetyltransferase [Cryobacterium sp. Y11]